MKHIIVICIKNTIGFFNSYRVKSHRSKLKKKNLHTLPTIMSQQAEHKMIDPAAQQAEHKMIDPAAQQQATNSNEHYRSPSVQEIDQLMTVVIWNQNNEMSELDYKQNPYYVNPALVSQIMCFSHLIYVSLPLFLIYVSLRLFLIYLYLQNITAYFRYKT